MTHLAYVSGVIVALAAPTLALATKSSNLTALRKEVKLLRQEERVVVKTIKARYNAVIGRDKLTEKELEAERRALDQQEREYLALATTAHERATIRKQFRLLREVLRGEIKLDAAVIAQLHEQERAEVKLISSLYKAKIAELEAIIHAAGKTGKK
jgi:hypothetical protein